MNFSDVISLFDTAKANAPCIINIDDVDAFCDPDGSGRFTEMMKQAKAEFIVRMGGVSADDGKLHHADTPILIEPHASPCITAFILIKPRFAVLYSLSPFTAISI